MRRPSSFHQNQSPQVAVVVFSRTAGEEAQLKPLLGSGQFKANKQIADHLIRHTLKEARKSGLPIITAFSDQQQGRTFGERLSNAFQEAYAQGYRKVIAIGNDCPSLHHKDLQSAARELMRGKGVLGPTRDGGAYLLGFDSSNFEAASFEALPWETATLWTALTSWSKQNSAVHELPPLVDLDYQVDLVRWMQQAPSFSTLLLKLCSILASWKAVYLAPAPEFFNPFRKPYRPLRAPPAFPG